MVGVWSLGGREPQLPPQCSLLSLCRGFCCLLVCLKGQGGRSSDRGRPESAGTFDSLDLYPKRCSDSPSQSPVAHPGTDMDILWLTKRLSTPQSLPGAAYPQKEVYYQKIVPERSKAHRHQTQEERMWDFRLKGGHRMTGIRKIMLMTPQPTVPPLPCFRNT